MTIASRSGDNFSALPSCLAVLEFCYALT